MFQAGTSVGLDAAVVQECIDKIKSAEVKDRLKQYTTEALDHGVR